MSGDGRFMGNSHFHQPIIIHTVREEFLPGLFLSYDIRTNPSSPVTLSNTRNSQKVHYDPPLLGFLRHTQQLAQLLLNIK